MPEHSGIRKRGDQHGGHSSKCRGGSRDRSGDSHRVRIVVQEVSCRRADLDDNGCPGTDDNNGSSSIDDDHDAAWYRPTMDEPDLDDYAGFDRGGTRRDDARRSIAGGGRADH